MRACFRFAGWCPYRKTKSGVAGFEHKVAAKDRSCNLQKPGLEAAQRTALLSKGGGGCFFTSPCLREIWPVLPARKRFAYAQGHERLCCPGEQACLPGEGLPPLPSTWVMRQEFLSQHSDGEALPAGHKAEAPCWREEGGNPGKRAGGVEGGWLVGCPGGKAVNVASDKEAGALPWFPSGSPPTPGHSLPRPPRNGCGG